MNKENLNEFLETLTAESSNDDKKKQKVINLLIKWGNNPKDVDKMVAKHYDYAAKTYGTPGKIAEAIRTIY